MNINRDLKLIKCSIKFKDNFNYQYFNSNKECLFEVMQGVYRFHDKPTMLRFMISLGITCGCERIKKNNKITWNYNKTPINDSQKEFLANRARALMSITDMNSGLAVKNECKCKNKKRSK